MEEKLYLALLHSLGISQKKLHIIFGETLFGREENYRQFYEKIDSEILKGFGIRTKEVNNILRRKQTITREEIQKKIEERKVDIMSIKEKEYPDSLKYISNPPYVLYVRGKIPKGTQMAVVGARKITSYGVRVIESIMPELSKFFPIVSGGAYGCDSVAHRESMKNGNITVSVLGTSISEDYPTGNKKMYDEIIETGGAIISIFPIGVPGSAYNFPIRNEIVVGLSVGVLVVEAQKKSGSLITAQLALDMGKDLFAVPGEIFKANSNGCNMLIKKGEAKLVTNAIDILEEYNISSDIVHKEGEKKREFGDDIEEGIYNALFLEGFSIDELAKKLQLDISILSFKLSMLEIKGIIKKTLGGKFEIKQ